ncbi:MAG: PhoH family protein [Clostridia bacterium]|nr:PhoH family protein [Clostridia bacterium]
MVIEDAAALFGQNDENLSVISDAFGVTVSLNADGNVRLATDGYDRDDEEKLRNAEAVIRRLVKLSADNENINKRLTAYLCDLVTENGVQSVNQYSTDGICVTAKGRPIKAKTIGQTEYVESIRTKSVTFGIGPAGTGKTYLAVAMAVSAFRKNEVSRIILTRPAVEAGEKLGFLPGDLQSKVDPYLRPLYDALYDIMGIDAYQKNFERGAIEIAPLAYMRGRTLDNSFIILDEAQNTTPEQLKMFLTRIGQYSKAVVTGDITQIDLPREKISALPGAQKILGDIDEVGFVTLTGRDVVRCQLVQKIIKAYEKYEKKDR